MIKTNSGIMHFGGCNLAMVLKSTDQGLLLPNPIKCAKLPILFLLLLRKHTVSFSASAGMSMKQWGK